MYITRAHLHVKIWIFFRSTPRGWQSAERGWQWPLVGGWQFRERGWQKRTIVTPSKNLDVLHTCIHTYTHTHVYVLHVYILCIHYMCTYIHVCTHVHTHMCTHLDMYTSSLWIFCAGEFYCMKVDSDNAVGSAVNQSAIMLFSNHAIEVQSCFLKSCNQALFHFISFWN